MRIIILNIAIALLCLITHHVTAQEAPPAAEMDTLVNQDRLEKLSTERERLLNKEKATLKAYVNEIEEKLAENQISP